MGKDNIGKYYDIKFWEVSLHLVKIVEVSNPQKIPIPFLYLSSIKKEIEGLGGGMLHLQLMRDLNRDLQP